MNRAYQSVWNETTRTWVAVAENAKGKRKAKGNVKAMAIAVAALGAASQAHPYSAGGTGNTAANDNGVGANVAIGTGAYAANTSNMFLTTNDGRNLQEFNIAIGSSASAAGAGSMAIGQYTLVSGQNAGVVGFGATASGAFGTVVGALGTAAGAASSALGYRTVASGDFSSAMGSHSEASGYGSVAIGSSTTSAGGSSIAIGNKSTSGGNGSVALGTNAVATNVNDVALGTLTTTAAVANTPGATIGGKNYSFAGTNAQSTVSVGSAGRERTITNVAAGQLTASSTDAVNGSELFATNQQVTQNTTDISHLQGNVTNINGQLADAVMYDTSAHDSVTLGGAGATTPVGLHNVAAGGLSASSTDAVNGSQLYATNQSISNLSGDVTNIAGDITNIDGQLADAVKYDASTHDSVTLGGAGATTPVGLHNVAAGELSANSADAVNGSQLYATNTQVLANTTTLGSVYATTPVELHNVSAQPTSRAIRQWRSVHRRASRRTSR